TLTIIKEPTPNDHFTAGPHCRVMASGERRVAGSYPTIGSRIVSPADVRIAAMIATPDDHLTATPHCRVKLSAGGCIGGVGSCPTIRTGIISPASVKRVPAIITAPDDHFAASPDCRVIGSARGCVGGAGGCPTIHAGIVSPAGVQIVVATIKKIPAPDNHFTPAPHCRVIGSCSGRVRGASAYPIVRAGIVSAAGVENAERIIGRATPDDHFAARPDCRVILSAIGRASGSYPGIIGASSRPIRYCGKRIVSTRRCHYLRHLVFRSGSPGLQRLFAPFNRSELQPVFGFLNYCRRVVTPFIF